MLLQAAKPQMISVALLLIVFQLTLLSVGYAEFVSISPQTPSLVPLPWDHTGSPPRSPQAIAIAPILTAPMIQIDSWSPDSKFLAYWTFTEEEASKSYLLPPGRLHFFEVPNKRSCTYSYVASGGAWNRALTWLPDGKVMIFTDGLARVGTPCRNDFAQIKGVFGVRAPGNSAWSPGEKYRATTNSQRITNGIISATTTIVDAFNGRQMNAVQWQVPDAKGELGLGGQWLTDEHFLIYESLSEGPLLVTIGREPIRLVHDVFKITGAPSGVRFKAYGTTKEGTNAFHILLYGSGPVADLPPIRLYHSESKHIEELPFRYVWWPPFSPDGKWLLMYRLADKRIYFRSVDELNADFRPLTDSHTARLDFAPSSSLIAISQRSTFSIFAFPKMTLLVSHDISDFEVGDQLWSPDSRWLAVSGFIHPTYRHQQGLFLVELKTFRFSR